MKVDTSTRVETTENFRRPGKKCRGWVRSTLLLRDNSKTTLTQKMNSREKQRDVVVGA